MDKQSTEASPKYINSHEVTPMMEQEMQTEHLGEAPINTEEQTISSRDQKEDAIAANEQKQGADNDIRKSADHSQDESSDRPEPVWITVIPLDDPEELDGEDWSDVDDDCEEESGFETVVPADADPEVLIGENCSNATEGNQEEANSKTVTPADSDMAALDKPVREFPEVLDRWPTSVDMEDIATRLARLLQRHCVMTDAEIDAIVLWVIASYLINSFRIFPKLSLISPEKRCGKTTTMEVIEAVTRDGVLSSNVSPAVIYRITKEVQLTLLIDEADTFVKSGDPQLTGIINAGHTQSGAHVIRCDGENMKPRVFSVWMPMVLASIGDLPPTIMDRSIVIRLRRKTDKDRVHRLPDNMLDRCSDLRAMIATWAEDHVAAIKANQCEPPKIGNDRAADNWVPLFRVADQIGRHWPARCEAAYRELTEVSEMELPTQLLYDIRKVLQAHSDDRITSRTLIARLCEDEDAPWSTYRSGKTLTPNQMAQLLAPYMVKPGSMRFDSGVKRGYTKQQFEDAFDRYLS